MKIKPNIVIIGAGFGGMQAAKSLNGKDANVFLVDQNNYHLFQPLLYQVAVSALSPGEIAVPIRSILRNSDNVRIIMSKAVSINKEKNTVYLIDGELIYDYLILAPGARHSYFGNDSWEKHAPGLKNLRDALLIRENLLSAFELAERNYHNGQIKKYLTFVIIGGGPTGVEMAGAIAEIARKSILPDFPLFTSKDIRVLLVEAGSRLLSYYPPELSRYTQRALEKMGVQVILNTRINEITEKYIIANGERIETESIIWAAGNKASPLLRTLNIPLDDSDRAIVDRNLRISESQNIFVIGDAAYHVNPDGKPTPGIAPAAIQQARYVVDFILNESEKEHKPFVYFDKGTMATIGKAKAAAMFGTIKIKGILAWLLWSFVHIFFLIDFRNRLRVMIEWIWFYITNRPGARLIIYNKDIYENQNEIKKEK